MKYKIEIKDKTKDQLNIEFLRQFQDKGKIYIYGGGEIANLTFKLLQNAGIVVNGFIIDDEYIKNLSNSILPTSYFFDLKEEYVIIIGFDKLLDYNWDIIKAIFPGCIKMMYFSSIYSENIDTIEKLSTEYYLYKKNEIHRIIEDLFDIHSKLSLKAYINAKINEDIGFLRPFYTTPQYFFNDIKKYMKEDEIFFDCGAYNGDSLKDMLYLTNGYYKSYYAAEPNENNMNNIKAFVEHNKLDNIIFINKAIADKRKYLSFSSRGEGSKIDEYGDITIPVDSIDNILKGSACTFIKMDIEGSEYDAIIGAKNTIQKYHPILCVSVYHKRDDLIKCYNAIRAIYNDYKFLFRIHKHYAVDAVLYAIPTERM